MTKEELLKEIQDKIEDGNQANGFFITITVLKGDKLEHYQAQHNFKKEDIKISLLKLGEMTGFDFSEKKEEIRGIVRQRTFN